MNILKKTCCLFVFFFTFFYLFSVIAISDEHQTSISSPPIKNYRIGVYYYPGWKIYSKKNRWEAIKEFPQREPFLGWYDESKLSITSQQLQWMEEYGIDFVVYDWYWKRGKSPYSHAINNYMKIKNGQGVKFAILWANHTGSPKSLSEFTSIIEYWAKNYFNHPNYLMIQNRPVVIIFSPQRLEFRASKFGKNTKELFELSQEKMLSSGYKSIYFIAATQAIEKMVNNQLPNSGYSALTSYNYHRGLSGKFKTYEIKPKAINYKELTAGYKESWDWILKNSSLPYLLPITSGWNQRPWGSNSEHDNCYSTPQSFRSHLIEAKKTISNNYEKTKGTAIICCWNEYGEGSYIEPTKKYKFEYLEQIKNVFTKD